MNLIKFIFINIFILAQLIVCGQEPELKGVKSIVTFKDSTLLGIVLLNNNGKVVLYKTKHLSYFYFDDKYNRLIKTVRNYNEDSSSITTFEYDNQGRHMKGFHCKNKIKYDFSMKLELFNMNNYQNLFAIYKKDSSALSKYKCEEKYLYIEQFFDKNEKLLLSIDYDNKYSDTLCIESYTYDNVGNLIFKIEKCKSFEKNKESNTIIFTSKYDSIGNMVSTKTIQYFDTTDYFYKYNTLNQKIEKKCIINGEFKSLELYEYKNNLISIKSIYNSDTILIMKCFYEYNNKGHLTKEIRQAFNRKPNYDYEENEKVVYINKYEYY